MMERTVMSIEKDRVDLEGILGKEDKDNAWQANEAIADSTERLLGRVCKKGDIESYLWGRFPELQEMTKIVATGFCKEFLVLKRGEGREL